jgi:translation initiation factor IF-1
MSPDKIEIKGLVKECLRGTEFLVEIDLSDIRKEIVGYISGKMRKHYVKVAPGDSIMIELSKYDLKRGRITKRL